MRVEDDVQYGGKREMPLIVPDARRSDGSRAAAPARDALGDARSPVPVYFEVSHL